MGSIDVNNMAEVESLVENTVEIGAENAISGYISLSGYKITKIGI